MFKDGIRVRLLAGLKGLLCFWHQLSFFLSAMLWAYYMQFLRLLYLPLLVQKVDFFPHFGLVV